MRCLTSCVTLTYKAVKWAKILTKRGLSKYVQPISSHAAGAVNYWPTCITFAANLLKNGIS